MAKPKEQNTENVKSTGDSNTSNPLDTNVENEKLKLQVEELTKMVAQLLQQTQQNTKEIEEEKTIRKNLFESNEEKYDIDPKDYFPITCMVNGGINLKGLHTKYKLHEFGHSISLSYEDLRAIVNNHSKAAREGMFLIKNEKAVKALSLEDYYEKFISQDMIKNIMKLPDSEIREIFNTTTNTIKNTIIETVVHGVASGDGAFQDRNKVKFIGDLVGKDLYRYIREIEDAE